jgi:cell division protein FtsI/penicillin-binding protein 2
MTRQVLSVLTLLGLLLPIAGCSSAPKPADVFASFADALQHKDAHAAAAQTTDPAAAENAITGMFNGMGEHAKLTVGSSAADGQENGFNLKYQWSWGEGHDFGYDTTGSAAKSGDNWRITWSPTLLHRDLRDGLSFQYSQDSELQTPVLDRTGQPLMSWQTVGVINLDRAHLESAAALAAVLNPFDPTTTPDSIAAQVNSTQDDHITVMKLREDDLGRVRDQLTPIPGVTVVEQGELLTTNRELDSPAISGLGQLWHDRITGSAGWSVYLVDAKGAPAQRLISAPPAPTEPVKTSLDMRLQLLAQSAVTHESRPAVLIALSSSTGGILAAAQNAAADPQGAIVFSGLYPPGSTFKTVTTAAALKANLVTPQTPVACPGQLTIEDRTIPNEDNFDLGTVPLTSAFAHSCNTSMAALADKLPADALTNTARDFGIGVDFTVPGLTTVTGKVPNADTAAQRVENGIGQGTVTVSPFGLAVAEASLAHGSTIVPALVEGEKTTSDKPSVPLSPNVIDALRAMMRQTVAEGTARELNDIPDLGGKTGTAEFGDNTHSHGWFAGIVGDIAFATLIVGGDSSAPAVALTGEFLRPALAGTG